MKLFRKRGDCVSNSVRVAFLLGLSIYAISGFAQQQEVASLTGKVTTTTGQNATNNLAGITVKLTGPVPASTAQTVVTDSEGRYEFKHVPPGSYNPEALIEGFKPQVSKVTIAPGQAATEDIAVQINSVEERVEVQGEATEVATQSATATATISDQQLENLPLAGPIRSPRLCPFPPV